MGSSLTACHPNYEDPRDMHHHIHHKHSSKKKRKSTSKGQPFCCQNDDSEWEHRREKESKTVFQKEQRVASPRHDDAAAAYQAAISYSHTTNVALSAPNHAVLNSGANDMPSNSILVPRSQTIATNKRATKMPPPRFHDEYYIPPSILLPDFAAPNQALACDEKGNDGDSPIPRGRVRVSDSRDSSSRLPFPADHDDIGNVSVSITEATRDTFSDSPSPKQTERPTVVDELHIDATDSMRSLMDVSLPVITPRSPPAMHLKEKKYVIRITSNSLNEYELDKHGIPTRLDGGDAYSSDDEQTETSDEESLS